MGGSGWRRPSPGLPLPVPTQERARETIRAAVEATVELLERLPHHEVTLEAIRKRSGVSQGSLSHHFRTRDGLIAAANVERYARSCASDAAFLARFEGAVDAPEPFAQVMLGLIDDVLTPERREARWMRIAAVAAGLGDDELRASLRQSFTALIDRMTALVSEGRDHGMFHPDIDPRTLAVLSSTQAQGLVLDDLAGDDTPPSGWKHFHARFVGCFMPEVPARVLADTARTTHGDLWRAEVLGPPGRVPDGAARRLATLRTSVVGTVADVTDPAHVRTLLGAVGVAPLPAPAAQLLALAVAHVRTHGARGLDVEQLRDQSGMSANSTFHRSFDGHAGLLRVARHTIEIDRSATSLSRFAQLIAAADTPAVIREGLQEWGGSMVDAQRRHALFQRAETIAAARTDLVLRDELGRTQRIGRDLLIEQVCLAQSRGLIDPSLPPAAVARFLDGASFWHLFHELDERRSQREEWIGMLRRIGVLLSPDR
jgi:AcrR family transcriptional regulator